AARRLRGGAREVPDRGPVPGCREAGRDPPVHHQVAQPREVCLAASRPGHHRLRSPEPGQHGGGRPGAVRLSSARRPAGRLHAQPVTVISSPLPVACLAASAFGAGPPTTEPSWIEYWLPWHGHVMMPPETVPTVHPLWVQIALNALNWPAVGWVTTTFWASKILPSPTGISLVLASPPPPPGAEEVAGAVDVWPPSCGGCP